MLHLPMALNIFRDDEQRDVLLLIDNIFFRFIQGKDGVSGLMGQMPLTSGISADLGTELSELEERIAYKIGANHFHTAVYVPADEFDGSCGCSYFLTSFLHP